MEGSRPEEDSKSGSETWPRLPVSLYLPPKSARRSLRKEHRSKPDWTQRPEKGEPERPDAG